MWDACLNVRDLGGLSCGGSALARGRLVRSSMLGALSDAGRGSVRAHGIRTVIDLRTDAEIAESPSPFRDGPTYRHVPFTAAQTMGLHRAAAGGTMPEALRLLAVPGGGLGPAIEPDKAAEIDAAIERRAWTMGELLATLRLVFGGAGAYLGTAGVTPAQLDAIRAKLLA